MAERGIGVVYLARPESGPDHIAAFAESYRKLPSGQDHRLVVCIKSNLPEADGIVARAFQGIDHAVLRVPDDAGYDLHAYLFAAARLPHEILCFCNTYTRLLASDWLGKLRAGLDRFRLVGATTSLQSMSSSVSLGARAFWLITRPAAFDEKLARQFLWMIGDDSPFSRPLYSRAALFRRRAGDAVKRRPSVDDLIGKARLDNWADVDEASGNWARDIFPTFPNAHVRTNMFMMSRSDFLAAGAKLGPTKRDCFVFESGWHGLSCRITRSGGELGLVGRDGTAFGIRDWATANCYRSGDQTNLLAADNQTDAYASLDETGREMLAYITWGDGLRTEHRNGALDVRLETNFAPA